MSIKWRFIWLGMLCVCAVSPRLRADVLEMQNGDRYSGKVLAVSADTVVLNSEVLGKLNVPRNQVARLTFGTNAAPKAAAISAPPAATNLPAAGAPAAAANTNSGLADLGAAFRQLGADTNFIGQIRGQMFAGDAGGAAKYDAMVSGLLSGQMNLNDLRQQAKASAAQLRELKRELGSGADESLDGYLQVLDSFIAETASQPATSPPAARSP